MMMFEAGKPVLCEKPLTCSAEDTRALIKAARDKGVFFMEVYNNMEYSKDLFWNDTLGSCQFIGILLNPMEISLHTVDMLSPILEGTVLEVLHFTDE